MKADLKIKVIGIGGAGGNVVQSLVNGKLMHVDFAAINTDCVALNDISVPEKLQIGHSITRGLSAGGDAAVGQKAAEEDSEKIEAMIEGCDMVFIIAGLGGGTGSGAASVVADIARRLGALAIVFATTPFAIEGGTRGQVAGKALASLRKLSHATVALPNDLLMQDMNSESSVIEAFELANVWVRRGVESIIDMIYKPGIINIDFSALKKALESGSGKTLYGLGHAEGENYVEEALNSLTYCPILHTPEAAQTADSLIINITGGRNLSLNDVNKIGQFVSERFKSRSNNIIGAVIDDDKENYLDLTLIGITSVGQRRGRGSKSDPKQFQQVLFSDWEDMSSKTGKEDTKEQADARGYFIETGENWYEGEDLDVPTYLRRGIKIKL